MKLLHYLGVICFIPLLTILRCSSAKECPKDHGLLRRLGHTRYFIVQNLTARGNSVSHTEGEAECKKYGHNMRLATINSMLTHTIISRELEKLVAQYHLDDTWYWINAIYDYEKQCYVFKNDASEYECLSYSAFHYRHPRPSGIGAHIFPNGTFDNDVHVPQCLTLALPWPGVKKQNSSSMFYGYHSILDERPCESVQRRHVLCENPDCKSEDDNDLYKLTDDVSKLPYFEKGNWIFGDRKYIVNWKQRTKKESEDYCEEMNLKLFEPSKADKQLIPFLKMWTRSITVIHYWTNFTYDVDPRPIVNTQRALTSLKDVEFKETKPTTTYVTSKPNLCLAMAHTYELKEQAPPCPPGGKSCDWSFIQYFPVNCQSYMATICQHADSESRRIDFQSHYIYNVEEALKETAFVEYLFKGNQRLLRSTYKQTFGSLYCPPDYELFTKEHGDDIIELPDWISESDFYTYDLDEEYWILEKAFEFPKQENETCSYMIPNQRVIKEAPCTEWRFYLCESRLYNGKYPNVSTPDEPKPLWNAEPQRRVFPIYTKGKLPENDTCTFDAQELRIQFLFLLDRHKSMKDLYSKMPDILNQTAAFVRKQAKVVEFGLAYFSRWEYKKSAGKEYTKKCYLPGVGFTTDISKILQQIKSTSYTNQETYYINIPSAGAFAFTDENLSWNRAEFDDDGRRVIRYILVFTGDGYNAPLSYRNEMNHNFGSRLGFVGDSSNTCERNRFITTTEFENIFRKNFACLSIFRLRFVQELNEFVSGTRALLNHWRYSETTTGIFDFETKLQNLFDKCLTCRSLYPAGYNTLGL